MFAMNTNNKRSREDGQISKEAYQLQSENNNNEIMKNSSFPRASEESIASRKIVTASGIKRNEFARHVEILNKQFYNFCKQELSNKNKNTLCIEASQDYIDYIQQLRDRYLREYGIIMTFGSGDCGQLAHGVENDEDLMCKYPRVVNCLKQLKVVSVACGGLHNAIVTADGMVHTWGCSDDGSLGREGDENVPGIVENMAGHTVLGVSCGDTQTICYTTTGDVYGWGCFRDKEGKKFFNPTPKCVDPVKDVKKQQNTPILIEKLGTSAGLSGIIEIACASSSCLARAEDGTVYSWGLGEQGQMSRGIHRNGSKTLSPLPSLRNKDGDYMLEDIYKYHMTPGLMMSLDPVTEEPHPIRNVKTIGCGNYHSLIVVVEKSVNTIYACGLNNYGQLGLGSNKPHDYLTPINTQWNGSVVQVAGGVHHSLALVHNNSSGSGNTSELYAWGRCDSGQLGVHRETKQAGDFVDAPVCVTIPDILSIQQISCGGNHNLALVTNNSNTNDVYSWGYGDMLALGHGVEKDEFVPKKINWNKCKDINNKKLKSMNISQVAGGGQHSAIIGTVIDTI